MVSGPNCKCILLYITGECKLFLILFSYKNMEKKKKNLILQIKGNMSCTLAHINQRYNI